MDPVSTSPALKALKYAEDELGVHAVHEAALKSRQELDECLTALSEARDEKRSIELQLQDAELEVAADERGKHPEMSAAAMDKHLKVALSKDDRVRELREQHTKLIGDVEGCEFDRSIIEVDIKIAVARLQELGGYLQYLAAIKQADTASKDREANTSQGDSK